jgi:hypothetical protein
MPGMSGQHRPPAPRRQSTTSRANHQAQGKKAPQASPCPPRHGAFCADPFLFARMWRACARGWRRKIGSHGLLVPARLQACLRLTCSPVCRVTLETCSLSAFVAVMFTRRLLDDERRGAVMQSRLCARPTNTRLYEPIF